MKRMWRSLARIRAINRKEWMHIGRDSSVLYFAIGMPLIMLVLFGFAVSFDLDHIKAVVIDDDHSAASRALIAHLDAGDTFDLAGTVDSASDAEAAFRSGRARMAIVIPQNYGRDLARGDTARVQVLVDAADNSAAQSILGYTARFTAHLNQQRLGSSLLVDVRLRALYNPSERSAVFLVPGLIAVIQAMMAVMLTALAVAREWERGSMEQLFATPVGRLEIVIGKLAPYFVIGVVQLLIVLGAAVWLFDVPVRGSPWMLGALSVTFLFAMLGQGLLISVMARNQMVATQMAGMSSMLPTMMLSGFILPIDNMPWILRKVTLILPGRHFIDGLRAVMLRDAPPSLVIGDVAKMAAFAAFTILLCVVRFRRKVA